jgi:hypothetical protein
LQINSDVKDTDRAALEATVKDFLDRYGERLADSRVEIHMQELQEHRRKQNLILTRVKIFSHKDGFKASAEEYGEIHSLKSALGKLETRIESTKIENQSRQRNRPKNN